MDNAQVFTRERKCVVCLLFIGGKGLGQVDLLRYFESNKSTLSVHRFCLLRVYVLRLYPLFLAFTFCSVLCGAGWLRVLVRRLR